MRSALTADTGDEFVAGVPSGVGVDLLKAMDKQTATWASDASLLPDSDPSRPGAVPGAVLRTLLPNGAAQAARNLKFRWQLARTRSRHLDALRAVRDKRPLTVAFLVMHESVWKCEQLYRLLAADDRFEPVICICPLLPLAPQDMHARMSQCAQHFESAGYRVVRSFDAGRDGWVDLKRELAPDVVFLTNPWAITRPEFLIGNFLDTLTCYVPYGFKTSHLHRAHYDQSTQNFSWINFLETALHRDLARDHARNRGRNAVVTGAPGLDALLDPHRQARDVWKPVPRRLKRIIWAPHHSIPGQGSNLDYSTFFQCCDYMLELARRRSDHIQVAFKPHPLLRSKLTRADAWGRERTDAYYGAWAELANGQVNDSDYVDLFLGSDAMIHDSASFIVEYLYTGKPVLFMVADSTMPSRLNAAGRAAFDTLYHGRGCADIAAFVDRVVIAGHDERAPLRSAVYQRLKPPGGQTASQNIYAHLTAAIFGPAR